MRLAPGKICANSSRREPCAISNKQKRCGFMTHGNGPHDGP